MSKRGMELNGIANLLALVKMAKGGFGYEAPDIEEIDAFDALVPQIELLERYMLAYNKAINDGTPTPYWHEVRDNPSKYPRNNGK